MNCPDLPIIILAAGASSRMRGRDKLMEDVDGQPLIRRQAEMARAITTGPVIVALPPAPHPRYRVLEDLDLTCLPISTASEGMGASFRVSTAALPSGATHAMYLLGDMPALTKNDLKNVIEAIDLKSDTLVWRGITQDGEPGHPIIFHANLFDALKALSGDTGGREVVARAGARVVHVPLPGTRARLDLDTPEDWAKWRASKL